MSQCSNITSGFIDLATYDDGERFTYGGYDATAYFIRTVRKSTWFTQVPVLLQRSSGTADFGNEFSVTVSRAGDYLLHCWLRVTVPEIKLKAGNTGSIRWTRNLMHNLITDACISFNDLTANTLNSYWLDVYNAFVIPAGKRRGYNNMIGNINELTQPHDIDSPIPSKVLNLPLPFFFTRDSGLALPTAALPYNEIRISFNLRDWNELLIHNDGTNDRPAKIDDLDSAPALTNVQVWSNYALVSTMERQSMSCLNRDILIEQPQFTPIHSFTPNTNTNQSFDIRFSHAIKALFFVVRNITNKADRSNYTTGYPVIGTGNLIDFNHESMKDPITTTSLVYENTSRLSNMGSDYFSLVQPFYFAPSIPLETGYHMYSYSLDFHSLDPMGSTNMGKLSNISITPAASPAAVLAANGTGGPGLDKPQKFQFICMGLNTNIIRISGGALGFPIL